MADDLTAALDQIRARDERVFHQRVWIIPPGVAEAFAAAMTERYGAPLEVVSTVGGARSLYEKHDSSIHITDGDQGTGERR